MKGVDVRLLGACAAQPISANQLEGLAPATVKRRLRALIDLNLLQATGTRRERRYAAARPKLSAAASQAVLERPDLPELLHSEQALRVLACLPDAHPSVAAQALSGVNRKTWARTRDQLAAANLVLDAKGLQTPNPNLPGLQFFLNEYRELYTELSPAIAEPIPQTQLGAAFGIGVMAYWPIHQAGLEAAWSISDSKLGPEAVPVGPTSNQEPYKAIVSHSQLVYHGPRPIDRWDHAFLYCLSQRRMEIDPTSPRGRRLGGDVAARAKALFLAMTTHDLAFDELFADRARFYRLGGLIADARQVHSNPHHPFWEHVLTMRRDFGVPEGYLAGQD